MIRFLIVLAFVNLSHLYSQTVTTSTLLDDLINLERLAEVSEPYYQVLHFTSFDRSSKNKFPDEKGWYANSDGFGNEPVPNFEQILEEPDENGIGKYLICDVEGPGAIVRTWTARFTGDIEVYLDSNSEPLYKGAAAPFFTEAYAALLPGEKFLFDGSYTQFLTGYFPIPFAKRCRIEWLGDIRNLHFYYLQIRKYEQSTPVQTFTIKDLKDDSEKIKNIGETLSDPGGNLKINSENQQSLKSTIGKGKSVKIFELNGQNSIQKISLIINSKDITEALRQNILRITFDDHQWGQVQAPVGDFFCTAPGINPTNSLPITVSDDGYMTCRFQMPFKKSCRIYIDNYSNQDCIVEGIIEYSPYTWDDNTSMHFHAKWRIDHKITTSDKTPRDLIFLMARGKGRYVGTSVYIMNPAEAPSSHGNWWGEGDEKIYIDNSIFPTVFGTGTEDYFGYAWSSNQIFNYSFIGQPRNDGPGNRGYVTNYRYHVIDDFPFNNNLDFRMELLHHDSIPGFSYGRTAYYYGIPGTFDDHQVISRDDVRIPKMPEFWQPKAFKGSRDFVFYEAESLLEKDNNTDIEEDPLWSENSILVWKPERNGEFITLNIPAHKKGKTIQVRLNVKKSGEGGKFSVKLNNNVVFDGIVDLSEDFHTLSRSIRLKDSELMNTNELTLTFEGETGQQIGLDFIWVKIE
jgi:hypothetical protein